MKTWNIFVSFWTLAEHRLYKTLYLNIKWMYSSDDRYSFFNRCKITFKVFVNLSELISVYILCKNTILKYTGLLNVLSKYNIL